MIFFASCRSETSWLLLWTLHCPCNCCGNSQMCITIAFADCKRWWQSWMWIAGFHQDFILHLEICKNHCCHYLWALDTIVIAFCNMQQVHCDHFHKYTAWLQSQLQFTEFISVTTCDAWKSSWLLCMRLRIHHDWGCDKKGQHGGPQASLWQRQMKPILEGHLKGSLGGPQDWRL